MDTDLAPALGCLAAALVLLALGIYAWYRQLRANPPTGLGPWREGGFYRLTSGEQRTVRRAVRRGEVLEDPRLAEAAWRMAEIAQHNRGRPWGVGVAMAIMGADQFAVLGLSGWWEWMHPGWGHLVVAPVILLCLLLSGMVLRRAVPRAGEPEDSAVAAAERAAEGNRAVVRAAGSESGDTTPADSASHDVPDRFGGAQ